MASSRTIEKRMRAIVFDLDGTLIESLPLIHSAANFVCAAHDLPPFAEELVREAIGDGARVLIDRLFREAFREAERVSLLSEFLAEYSRATCEEDDPWRPGARALLDRARELGLRLAILSNKPLHLTEAILERTGTLDLFDAVRGPENSPAAKPDPRALTELIDTLGVDRTEVVFVGDSIVDFETGKRAGVETIGLRGGYRAEGPVRPDLMLEDPGALAEWLAREVPARESTARESTGRSTRRDDP